MLRPSRLPAALLPMLFALACQRDPLRGLDADATAPASLEFGQLEVGAKKSLALTVTNTGVLELSLAAQVAAPFSLEAQPASIKAGDSAVLHLTFAPAAKGQFDQPLTLTLSSLRTPSMTVRLTGAAIVTAGPPPPPPPPAPSAATLVVAPDHLTFTSTLPATPAAQTLSLSNGGDLGLTWTAAADGPELSLSVASGALAGHATSQVTVSVATSAATNVTRHITFTAKAAAAIAPVVVPVQLALAAPAPGPAALLVEPRTLTFTSVLPAAVAAQSFRVHNTGGSPLHFTLGLAGALSLSAAPHTGTVAPGEVATVTVAVPSLPALPGLLAQTILVTTDEAGQQDVAVSIATSKPGPPPPPPQYGGSVWPKFHQGNSCTGLSSVATNTRGHVRWRAQFGPARMGGGDGTYVNSPSLAEDGTVYQLGGDGGFVGHIMAFEPLHGGALWTTDLTSPASMTPSIEATPTVVKDGSVFVMTGAESASGHFFKLSHAGHVLWQDAGNYGDGFDSSPALGADGTLYLAYDDGPSVIFFNQGASPALPSEQGRTTVPDGGGWFETQSAAIGDDGTGYWADNGVLQVVARDGFLWSHDTHDGDFNWVDTRSAPMLTPAGNVVLTYANTDFSGANVGAVTTTVTMVTGGRATGRRVWQAKLGPTLPVVTIGPTGDALKDRYGLSSPALGPDGTIYIGHADGLYALDPANGHVKWHAPGALVASSPAVGADGTIFYGAMDGKLHALNAAGHEQWSVPTGGQVNSSPAIGADGAVFVASDDGFLYAVE